MHPEVAAAVDDLYAQYEQLQALQRAQFYKMVNGIVRVQGLVVRHGVREVVKGQDPQRVTTAEAIQRFGRTADGWKRLCRKHRAELAEFKRGRGLWYWPRLEAWGIKNRYLDADPADVQR